MDAAAAAAVTTTAAAATAVTAAAAAAPFEAQVQLAAANGDAPVLSALLVRGVRACGGVPPGGTVPPVVAAARGGHVAALTELLEAARRGRRTATAAGRGAADPPGVGVGARGVRGQTPFHAAAAGGHAAAVRVLLDAFADGAPAASGGVDATDATGTTALQEAVYAGAPAVVTALLDAGAAPWVCARRKPAEPLLYGAIAEGHFSAARRAAVVRALLAVSPEAANTPLTDSALTPLHLAVHVEQPAVVLVLLEGGARRAAVDAEGWTPLERCAEWGADAFPLELVQSLVAAREGRNGGGGGSGGNPAYGGTGRPLQLSCLMKKVCVASCGRVRCAALLRQLASLQNERPMADAKLSPERARAVSLSPYRATTSVEAAGVAQGVGASSAPGLPAVSTRLDDLDHLYDVYGEVVANPALLQLSVLDRLLERPRLVNSLSALRAGHNLLVLAAKNGCLGAVHKGALSSYQSKWMQKLYFPCHSALLRGEVPLAEAILTDAGRWRFLKQYQVELVTCHFHASSKIGETFRELYARVSRLKVNAKVLIAAAATTHKELLDLDLTLKRVAARAQRRALQMAIPKIGLSLLPLVGSALGTALETVVGVGVSVSEAGLSSLRQAGLDFSVDHSNLGAALTVLSSHHATREVDLFQAIAKEWSSFDRFLETLAEAWQAALPGEGESAEVVRINELDDAGGDHDGATVSWDSSDGGGGEGPGPSSSASRVWSVHSFEAMAGAKPGAMPSGTSCVLCTYNGEDSDANSPWPKPLPCEVRFKTVCAVCVADLLTGWVARKGRVSGWPGRPFPAAAVRAAAGRGHSHIRGDAVLREGSPTQLATELLSPPPDTTGFARQDDTEVLREAIESLQRAYGRLGGGSVGGSSSNISGA